MYQRLVVPLDGSDIAEYALVEAEKMAALTGAPIHIVRVIDVNGQDTVALYGTMTDSSTATFLLDDEVESAREYLESVARRIVSHGHGVTCEVRRGPVANELIAASKPGDLYMIASHGRTGIARWFMGSIAEDVVRRSSVSVLLIKASSYNGRYPETGPFPIVSTTGTAPLDDLAIHR